MKIKTDFVTNSSTTVYLCYVPDDFSINLDFINNSGVFTDYNHGYSTPQELLEAAHSKLEELRESHQMDTWDDFGAVYVVQEALDKRGCIIKSLDVGGSEGTYYVGLTEKDIDNIANLKKEKETPDENQIGLHHQ
jgi:hypothetical protein